VERLAYREMEAKRIEQRRRIVEVTPDMVRRRQAAERIIREQSKLPLTATAWERSVARQLRRILASKRDA